MDVPRIEPGTFARLLRSHRERCRMSRRALAALVGRSARAIQKWETVGQRPAQPTMVEALAEAMGLTPPERRGLLRTAIYERAGAELADYLANEQRQERLGRRAAEDEMRYETRGQDDPAAARRTRHEEE